jgi:uncharacterized protein YjiS (DUF1127 family)
MRTISVHGAVSGGRTSDWLEAMGSRLRRFGAAWEERRRLAQDVAALYQLPEAELRDMGLNRGDLPAVLSGRYRRD